MPVTVPTEATPDSGRITGVAAHPSDPNTIYVATAGGGVWKTMDGGVNWAPLTDNQATLAMGAIAISPTNPQVIYAGTGEANGNTSYGRGVLVSTDAGATWTLQTNKGAFDRSAISEIAIDPGDSNVAYVALASDEAINSATIDNGIYKTTDGGLTWTNTTVSISTEDWSSVQIDPKNPSILYAAVGNPSGRNDNGVYKSVDAGSSYNLLTGLPKGLAAGRIKVALAKSDPKVIYVSVVGTGKAGSARADTLYKLERSNNSGATFTDLTARTPAYLTSGSYATTLIVDPSDPAVVYAGGSSGLNSMIRSADSGRTWTDISGSRSSLGGPHVDHHAQAFDANGKLLDGDDGGIFRLDDPTAVTWASLNNTLNTIQITGVGISPTDLNRVVAGTQDNGTVTFTGNSNWAETDGGDGGPAKFSKQNSSRAYHQAPIPSFGLDFFQRSDDAGLTWNAAASGITDNTSALQNFYSPFVVDPNDGNRVIYGARHAWETTNGGTSWTALGAAFPANIDAIDLSADHPNTIYVSAGGSLYVTKDKGLNWIPRSFPVAGTIKGFAVAPADSRRGVAVVTSFTTGCNVFYTNDEGATWKNITSNLPNVPVSAVQFHGNSIKTLYVATDIGVYKTTDAGGTWNRFGTGLPNVQVADIQLDVKLGILAAGTYGRGAWEIKLPPATNTTTRNVEGQAGALVTLKADVTPSGSAGSIVFEVNGVAVPGSATYDSATGHAEQPFIINLPAGTYQITADFISSNDALGGNSGAVSTLTVK